MQTGNQTLNKIDVIILSNTLNLEFYNLLQRCIDSIYSNTSIQTNIIIVETNTKLKGKNIPLAVNKNIQFVFPDEPFNYNRFLNFGIEKAESEHILISNNDVIYNPNCLNKLYESLKIYDSVSPWDLASSYKFFNQKTTFIEGNTVGQHVTGYSIMVKRNTLNIIGKFDERFSFWYQDNDYCNLLKHHNLKHALVTDALCTHLGSQSFKLLSITDIQEKIVHPIEILKNKWNNI